MTALIVFGQAVNVWLMWRYRRKGSAPDCADQAPFTAVAGRARESHAVWRTSYRLWLMWRYRRVA